MKRTVCASVNKDARLRIFQKYILFYVNAELESVAHIQTYCSGVCKVVLPWIGWGGVLRQAECMPVVHHSVVNVPFVHARQR